MSKLVKVGLIGFNEIAKDFLFLLRKKNFMEKLNSFFPLKSVGPYSINSLKVVLIIDAEGGKVNRMIRNLTNDEEDWNKIEIKPGIPPLRSEKEENRVTEKRIVSLYKEFVNNLKHHEIDVLVLFAKGIPEETARMYAELAIEMNAGFINASKFLLTRYKRLLDKFKANKLPIMGDLLKGYIDEKDLLLAIIAPLKLFPLKVDSVYGMTFIEEEIRWDETRYLYELENKLFRLAFKEICKEVGLGITHKRGMKNIVFSSYWLNLLPFLGKEFEITLSIRWFNNFMRALSLLDLIRVTALLKDKGKGGLIKDLAAVYFYHPGAWSYIPLEEKISILKRFLSNNS